MDIDTLIAEREISRQLIRLARAMDERDWEAVGEIVTDNIRSDLGLGEIRGRSEMIAFIRQFLDNCGTTQHLLGNILIEVDGDRAVSDSYVSDMHVGIGDNEGMQFCTLGNYRDEWRKFDGRWLLRRRSKDNRATLGSIEALGVQG